MFHSPSRIVLAVVGVLALTFAWYYGRGRWRTYTSDRLIYGVPWGTLIIVGVNVGFYLFAQNAVAEFGDPVLYPFVSWSYFYPTGMVTSGIAHGGPAHLFSNMTGTLAFGTVAEYAWGHYPPSEWADEDKGATSDSRTDTESAGGWLARPWIRAAVVVPGALLACSYVASLFAVAPGIGFSGVVFAILGFAVVLAPLSSVVAVVVSDVLRRLVTALWQPTIRAGVESGPPSPPSWAGIGFQTHMFGFLLGVLVALAVLSVRDETRSFDRSFFGMGLVGLGMILWLVVWPADDDVFVMYQAIGVSMVIVLTVLIAVAAAGSRTVERARVSTSRVTRRQAATILIVLFTCLVGVVGIPLKFVAVENTTIEGSESVSIRNYEVAYVDNATTGHTMPGGVFDENELASNVSGVVVVSDDREMWSTAVRKASLTHSGDATVKVGGLTWRKTVEAERKGWDVVGNDSAYYVDLSVDGREKRSFTTDPVRADVRIANQSVAVDAAAGGFFLQVSDNGTQVGRAPLPGINETVTVGDISFRTEKDDGEEHLVARADGTRVRVATRED